MIASLSFSTLVMMRERSWDCWCSWGDSWGEKEEKVMVSGLLSRGEGRKVETRTILYHLVVAVMMLIFVVVVVVVAVE